MSSTATATQPARVDPYTDKTSIEFQFRVRRFAHVRRLIESAIAEKGRCDILDLGGTEIYWLVGEDLIRKHRDRLHFTILNTEPQQIARRDLFSYVHASATEPDLFADRTFDLVHSNSVVEHFSGWAEMEIFARNVRRLAPRYYIQTPNYWFPYEPHFRFPGFQYLPESVRVRLMMKRSLGFFQRIEDRAVAEDIVQHHRLLSTRDMRRLFPDAEILHEKFVMLNKSIIALRDATEATH